MPCQRRDLVASLAHDNHVLREQRDHLLEGMQLICDALAALICQEETQQPGQEGPREASNGTCRVAGGPQAGPG